MSDINESNVSSEAVGRPQCNDCQWFNPRGLNCKAFPDRIPERIISNQHDHNLAYKGDNGVRFKKKKR